MKKLLSLILVFGLQVIFIANVSGDSLVLCYPLQIIDHQDKIKKDLNAASLQLEKKGIRKMGKLLQRIKQNDGVLVYIIDAETGAFIIHSPYKKTENHLFISNVNGKVAVKYAKEQNAEQKELGWMYSLGPLTLKDSFSRLTRASSGKQYVVIATDNEKELEKKIVEDLVNAACSIIKKKGMSAFPVFYNMEGEFRYKSTRIFIYNDHGVCLLDPCYPEDEGKNMMIDNPLIIDASCPENKGRNITSNPVPIKKIIRSLENKHINLRKHPIRAVINCLKTKNASWVLAQKEKSDYEKVYYVKKIAVDGNFYIVGTSVPEVSH